MKFLNKMTIGIVCLLMFLSTMALPQIVSEDTNPDLLVGNVHFFDYEQGLEISAAIKNDGLASASNIEVAFYDGDALLGENFIDTIAPSEYGLTSLIWSTPSEGLHDIIVIVDPSNTIPESIETNNEVTVDTDIVIEDNDILHLVWENIGDGKIHYMNNIQVDWTHTQWTLSWTKNLAINPQIEVDSDRVLHVTWIEITSGGLILMYAWSYNHIWTWFDRYELTPSSSVFDLIYDIVEELMTVIIEVGGEIIESILNADPNHGPPYLPPDTRGPLDDPPEIEITKPESEETVIGDYLIYGTTTEHDYPIHSVDVQIGAEQIWNLADDTSPGSDWSTWEYDAHFKETGGTPIDIRARVKDTANPPNVREHHIVVYEGEVIGYTHNILVVENHIYHTIGFPQHKFYPNNPHPLLSPWIYIEGEGWLHYLMIWRSKHRVEDEDRVFDQYTKSVIIRCDCWYDIKWNNNWETEISTGIPDLNDDLSDNAYEGHRQDIAGQYTQEDVDNGVDVTYTQFYPRDTPNDGTEPPDYESEYLYRATVRTQLIEFTSKTQPDGSLYKEYYNCTFKSWENPLNDEFLMVYV